LRDAKSAEVEGDVETACSATRASASTEC
jgi:hypothetical protein